MPFSLSGCVRKCVDFQHESRLHKCGGGVNSCRFHRLLSVGTRIQELGKLFNKATFPSLRELVSTLKYVVDDASAIECDRSRFGISRSNVPISRDSDGYARKGKRGRPRKTQKRRLVSPTELNVEERDSESESVDDEEQHGIADTDEDESTNGHAAMQGGEFSAPVDVSGGCVECRMDGEHGLMADGDSEIADGDDVAAEVVACRNDNDEEQQRDRFTEIAEEDSAEGADVQGPILAGNGLTPVEEREGKALGL